MYHFSDGMSSDRTLSPDQSTSAVVNRNVGLVSRGWRRGKRQLGLGMSVASWAYMLFINNTIIAVSAEGANAQNITLDGSLGPAAILNGPNYLIPEAVGQTVGNNLFHSFGQFNLNAGESAGFQSAANIRTIFSRVTGGLPSAIDGQIFTESPSVNLFLINPSGIAFGPNASINIGSATRGSFVATTANGIQFGTRGAFVASPAQTNVALLTVNPSAFLFNQIATQPIVNQALLQVNAGQSLLLVGGDMQLNGGRLLAPGGRVDLGGVAGSGAVGLNIDGNTLSLRFPEAVGRADVSLVNGSEVNVQAGGGGSIAINARNLKISGETPWPFLINRSSLIAGIGNDLGSVDAQAGDITLNATGEIAIDKFSPIQNDVRFNATGKGGNIYIQAGSLIVNGSEISTRNSGQGDAGNISIQVKGNISAVDIGLQSVAFGKGNSGNISLLAGGDIFFANPSGGVNTINTDIFGQGKAGNIVVQAGGTLSVTDTNIFSASNGQGNGGSLSLLAGGDISFVNSFISSNTNQQGDAGNIVVQAGGNVSLEKASFIFSDSNSFAQGNAGDIVVLAGGSVSLAGDSEISSATSGKGDAGTIVVQANNSVFLADSDILSNVKPQGEGKGGDISIQARSLTLTEGATLFASTQGQGKAGNIFVNATDFVSISGTSAEPDNKGFRLCGVCSSGLVTNTDADAIGTGGDITVTTNVLQILDAGVLSARTSSNFQGGNITANVNTLDVTGGGQILTTAFSRGNAGHITVNATQNVTLSGTDPTYFDRIAQHGESLSQPSSPASGLFANTTDNSRGKGGTIAVNTANLIINNSAGIGINSSGRGSAGSFLNINARDVVALDNGFITSRLGSQARGQGGAISIQTGSLFLMNGSQLEASTAGLGNAGSIVVGARDVVNLTNSSRIRGVVESTALGNGGEIYVTARSLSLTNGAILSSSTSGTGDAGNIGVSTTDSVSIFGANSGLFTNTNSAGKGGDITVNTRVFRLNDYAILNAETSNIRNGGDITVKANTVEVANGAVLSSSTSGQGNAGKIAVQADESVVLTNNSQIRSAVELGAQGNGNEISITARSLSLTNGAFLSSNTSGAGDAGNIAVNTTEVVSISGMNSGLLTNTNSAGKGGNITVNTPTFQLADNALLNAETSNIRKGGEITVQANTIALTNGARMSSSTSGAGDAGGIQLNASDSVSISGTNLTTGFSSGLFTSTNSGGKGGEIVINTSAFRIEDGAVLNARTTSDRIGGEIIVNTDTFEATNGGQLISTTTGNGQAGNITLNATRSVTLSGGDSNYTTRLIQFGENVVTNEGAASGLFAQTTGAGTGGKLTITTGQLQVLDGAKVSASTSGEGTGGTLVVTAPEFVTLNNSGSGLFAQSSATGTAGNLTVTTGQLRIQNGAEVTVSSPLGQAGNLTVTADAIRLSNRGKLTAVTGAGDGGNITLQGLDLLLMRDTSLISAEALRTANGGNITIDADFIVAVPSENSDIVANAFRGRGGNITITTNGIYGLEYRQLLTRLSDINASSEFGINGTVQIITPGVDPSRGLANLPTEVVDASNQIAQNCPAGGGKVAQNEFIVTGRGGLPDNPNQTLSTDALWTDLRPIPQTVETRNSSLKVTPPNNSRAVPLVEASGWIINAKGEVVLTASAPSVTPVHPGLMPATCPHS